MVAERRVAEALALERPSTRRLPHWLHGARPIHQQPEGHAMKKETLAEMLDMKAALDTENENALTLSSRSIE